MVPRRILIIAEGQLGDLLLLTPSFRALKSTFPLCELSVLVVTRRDTPRQGLSVKSPIIPHSTDDNNPLATNPHIDFLYILDRPFLRSLQGVRRLKAELAVTRFLRRCRFDAVISTFPEDRFAIYAYLSGAGMRIGQHDQKLRWLLTKTPGIRKDERGVLRYYLELTKELGAKVTSEETEYPLRNDARRWAGDTLRKAGIRKGDRLILIHPGATGPYKIWPPERFSHLTARLVRLPGVRVAVCSGREDGPVVNAMRKTLPRRVPILDTGGRLPRLAALMERSDLCVSNDSGPRHLAVAVGTRSLAIFRHHHDREWNVYPESTRCGILQGAGTCPVCPHDVCLDRIPSGEQFGGYCVRMVGIDEVVRKIREMLRQR